MPASSMILLPFILAAAILSILPLRAEAADVKLAWDANLEDDIAGYHVGYGVAPGSYSSIIDVGNTTAHKVVNLEPNRIYYFVVRAYNFQGSMSPFSAEVSTSTPSPQVMMTSVSMDRSSPKPVGTAITFSANASGGATPYQYRWFVANGLSSTLMNDWSTTTTFTWQPSDAGTYQITAWVRSAGAGGDAAADATSSLTVPFRIDSATTTTAPKPVTVAPPTPSMPSPQQVGTAISFTANGSGGVSPLQYRWLISTGQGWMVTQDWGTSNSFSLTPTVASTLWVRVQVRSATNTTDIPDAQHLVVMTVEP